MSDKKKTTKKKAAKKKVKKARVKLKINGYNKANQIERQLERFMDNKASLSKDTAVEYHKLACALEGFAGRLKALSLKEMGYEVVTVAQLNTTVNKEDS